MPSLIPQKFSYENVNFAVGLPAPDGWQRGYRSLIRIKMTYRDPMVGTSNYSEFIPREWSGRWYLYRDGYQQSSGVIDFRTLEIYSDTQDWLTGPNLQQLGQRVPIPETDEETENIEELSEFFVLGGETLAPLIQGLNIPIIGDIVAAALNFFENLSSDDIYYLPFPYRPDILYVSIPDGKVSVNVEYIWWEYSKIAVAGGIGEIDIQDVIELPDTGNEPEDPLNGRTPFNFADYARERGFVPEGQCAGGILPDEGEAIEGEQLCDGASSGRLSWDGDGDRQSVDIFAPPYTYTLTPLSGSGLDWFRLDYIDDVSGSKQLWVYGWENVTIEENGVTTADWVTTRSADPGPNFCPSGTPTSKVIFRIEPGTEITATQLGYCAPLPQVNLTVQDTTGEVFNQTYDDMPDNFNFECFYS